MSSSSSGSSNANGEQQQQPPSSPPPTSSTQSPSFKPPTSPPLPPTAPNRNFCNQRCSRCSAPQQVKTLPGPTQALWEVVLPLTRCVYWRLAVAVDIFRATVRDSESPYDKKCSIDIGGANTYATSATIPSRQYLCAAPPFLYWRPLQTTALCELLVRSLAGVNAASGAPSPPPSQAPQLLGPTRLYLGDSRTEDPALVGNEGVKALAVEENVLSLLVRRAASSPHCYFPAILFLYVRVIAPSPQPSAPSFPSHYRADALNRYMHSNTRTESNGLPPLRDMRIWDLFAEAHARLAGVQQTRTRHATPRVPLQLVVAESAMRTAHSSALDDTTVSALKPRHAEAPFGAEPGTEERDIATACRAHNGRGDGAALRSFCSDLGQSRATWKRHAPPRVPLQLVVADSVMHTADASRSMRQRCRR
ncbi:hypothetical protein DFH06DRAFT_1417124 [Mycena polygramma]|nr:hypothetical protein DFH06DRAFT_1417124 [Mycena polygramma]